MYFWFHIVLGVKVLEMVISIFIIDTVIVVSQMFVICYIAFVYFTNPIEITNGLFLYIILIVCIGWAGFLSGEYFMISNKNSI